MDYEEDLIRESEPSAKPQEQPPVEAVPDLSTLRTRRGLRRVYREPVIGFSGWIALAVITVILALVIRAVIVQSFKIPSESMLPLLQRGDHILVDKHIYGISISENKDRVWAKRRPKRGDVVVFEPPEEIQKGSVADRVDYYIKRIVALPGDTVEVKDFYAYVNGENVDSHRKLITSQDKEAIAANQGNYGPITLREDEYFVLGDNRVNSKDSRYFGPIYNHEILGQAFVVYFSLSRENGSLVMHWSRVGRKIY